MIQEILKQNLKRLRQVRGLTQAELAERADVSLSTIQAYEALRAWPGLEYIASLARALDVHDYELFIPPQGLKKTPNFNRIKKEALAELLEDIATVLRKEST